MQLSMSLLIKQTKSYVLLISKPVLTKLFSLVFRSAVQLADRATEEQHPEGRHRGNVGLPVTPDVLERNAQEGVEVEGG
jgi:hypothetical protein